MKINKYLTFVFLVVLSFIFFSNIAKADSTGSKQCGWDGITNTPIYCQGEVVTDKECYAPGESIQASWCLTSPNNQNYVPVVWFDGIAGTQSGLCQEITFTAGNSFGTHVISTHYVWDVGVWDYFIYPAYAVSDSCGSGGEPPPPPPGGGTMQVSLQASPNPVDLGLGQTSATLSWDVSGGTLTPDGCTLKENGTQIASGGTPGQYVASYTETGTHTYDLECSKYIALGPKQNHFAWSNILERIFSAFTEKALADYQHEVWAYASITVTITYTPPSAPTVDINTYDTGGNPISVIPANTTFHVSWISNDATYCELIGPSPLPGNYSICTYPRLTCSFADQITTQTTYSSRCYNSGGQDEDAATMNLLVQNTPDLTAYPPTPTTAEVGDHVVFSAQIKNIGTATTGPNAFPNFFQITDLDPGAPTAYRGGNSVFDKIFPKANASMGLVDMSATMMPALGAGQNDTSYSPSFPFVNAGMYWVRACADKYNRNTTHTSNPADKVNEDPNENNNCSSWAVVTVGDLPDLKASNTTPVTAIINTPVALTSTITNQGGVSTGTGFYNFFQVSTENENNPVSTENENNPGGGNNTAYKEKQNIFGAQRALATGTPGGGQIQNGITNLAHVWMNPLGAGQSAQTTKSYAFNSIGSYWVRACSDKSTPGDPGTISELNEGNNCSPLWTEVVVTANTNLPDLVAGVPTSRPTTLTINVPVVFSSTITNQGTTSTGASFYNFAQIGVGEVAGVLIDLPSVSMATLPAGGHNDFTRTYTFTSPGTYYVRVCADKSNRNDAGTITESNELNNCSSPWAQFTVLGQSMTGTLTPDSSSCTILLGAKSCPMHFIWSVTNPTGPTTEVIQETVGVVGSGNPGSGKFTIPYNSAIFRLYNDSIELDQDTITSSCEKGSVWNGEICADENKPVDGKCATTHYGCLSGNSANGTGDSINGWTWDCLGSPTGSNASCSEAGNGGGNECPPGLTNYPECDVCLNGATNPPDCTTGVIPKKALKWFER